LALALAAAVAPRPAAAQNSNQALDFTIYQPFVSARALGMGNAFTAIADDYSALFYNPAGLARLAESETNLEVRGMIDSGVIQFKNDVASASSSSTSATQLNQILVENYGKHYSSRLPTIGAYYARPHWGLAFIPADLSLELGIHQLVGPAASVVATQDSTLALGFGWDVGSSKHDRFSFGITFKGVYREYYNRAFTALDLATDSSLVRIQDAEEGFTLDADVGILYTPHVGRHGLWAFLNPTWGV
jgi:hypothetical protein